MHWLAALIIFAQIAMQLAPQAPLAARAAQQSAAQAGVTITDLGAEPAFGQQIAFNATVQPGDNVSEMWVYITPEGQRTVWQQMTLEPLKEPPASSENPSGDNTITGGGDTTASGENAGGGIAAAGNTTGALQASATVDVRQEKIVLFPFSKVDYYFEAKLKDGPPVKSQSYTFDYVDDRFTWQSAEDDDFQAYWNSTDTGLGQTILSIAHEGLRRAQEVLEADAPKPVRIYAYSSSRDLQTALQMTNQTYIAGHATPEMGMIMISVPSGPERKLELERQIPHELMHILQYQVMGKQFTNQPVWLVEGMASLAELSQNPEYRRVLEATAQERQLLPISRLCTTFPSDASGAFLAYAESDSFVRFLHQKYGTSGLRKLVDSYKNGLGCEEGVLDALGVSLRQVEYRWQQESLGMNAGALALSNLSPYLLLGVVVLVIPIITFLLPFRVRKTAAQGGNHG